MSTSKLSNPNVANPSRRGALAGLLLGVVLLAAPHCPGPRVVAFEAPGTRRHVGALRGAGLRVARRLETRSIPSDVELWGEFEAPDGELFRMPGFATLEYTRELVGGFEKRRASSGLHWRVRFTPTRPGTWRWRWQPRHARRARTTRPGATSRSIRRRRIATASCG